MPQRGEAFGRFRTDDDTPPILRGGEIVSYNPETDLYTVNVDGFGDIDSMRAVKYGVYRPYPEETRVICVCMRGVYWSIIGGLPKWQKPEDPPKSPADTIAAQDKELRRATADKYQVFAASARKLDEELHYEGDSVLDNNKGSFIKILESGDIWGLASYACFFLLSKVKNVFIARARDALISFAGFIFNVETDTSVKQATAKLDVTGDQKEESDPDFSVRAGYLGGQDLFEQKMSTAPSQMPELLLPTTNVAGGVGDVSSLDALSTETPSVSSSMADASGTPVATKDGRVLWTLLGDHTLLEVDNASEEVRLSRVSAQRNARTGAPRNTEKDTKQVRLNGSELALQWKDRWVSLNDSRVSVSYGDNYFSVDDKKLSMVFGENFIIVNKNGVQIKGYLELVGGSINLVDETVGAAYRPETGGVAAEGIANMQFSSLPLPKLDLTMNLTVNKLALVNEVFLPAYDQDMLELQKHSHPLDPNKTTALPAPDLAKNLDQPTKQSQKSALTSNVV